MRDTFRIRFLSAKLVLSFELTKVFYKKFTKKFNLSIFAQIYAFCAISIYLYII